MGPTKRARKKQASCCYENIFGWLVVGPTPLKNMSSSVGMMTFPTEWKKTNVPKYEFASWGYYSQYIYIWKVMKFHGSKAPTS